MKIAFSTLGCPDWSFNEIISTVKDLGFDGVEIRGLENQLYIPKAVPFSKQYIERTKSKLKSKEINISCLTSSCYLFDEDNIDENITQGKEYIDLANEFKIPYIRVLGDKGPSPLDKIDINLVKKNLITLGDYASTKNVIVLIETNGIFANSKIMADIMNDINHENIGVLWDIHHPYRFMNESITYTYNNLNKWIKYIHVKDSIYKNNLVEYKMIGYGDIPFNALIKILVDNNYPGYVTLEWVKRWNQQLQSPGIVFPHYINAIKTLIHQHTINKSTKNNLLESTIGDFLDNIALKYPDNQAIVYGDQNFKLTYKQFVEECNKVAKGFISMGIKKGDHIAIWSTNYPQWIITEFASAKIGAILVTVNTNYKIFETEYLLRQSDATTLILMEGFKDTNYINIIEELCPELNSCNPGNLNSDRLPLLKNIIYLGTKKHNGMYHWDDLYNLSKITSDQDLKWAQNSLDINDTINMQYTSGTTGFPKGVMLTHHNILNNGKSIGDCLHLTPADRLCVPVPFFHCFGCVLGILAAVTHGSTIVAIDHYNPVTVMKTVHNEKCTALHGVPTMFIAILDHPDFSKYNFSPLRTGIMAGSPCPEKVMRQVVEQMGMKEITIAYGQTEASPVCTQTTTNDSIELRVTTVGKCLPNIKCKIVDPETNKELPINVAGEFVVKGYNVMKGYYKMPEATTQAIDTDGWLHTGDLATIDENGYFKITGRIKDMIIRGGENIYPKEIEEFLYTLSDVLNVQVVGIPDKTLGEEVGAFIILKEDSHISEEDIKKIVSNNLARHKVPKHIFFVNELPLTASGKIQKYKLRDLAINLLYLDKDDIDATV